MQSIDDEADGFVRILLLVGMEPIGKCVDDLLELLGISKNVPIMAGDSTIALGSILASLLTCRFFQEKHPKVNSSINECIGER